MIHRGRDRRLDAVARTYLNADAPRSRLVVVAGEDVEATALASRAVQSAANDLGVPTVLLNRGSETVDLELGSDQVPPLVVYHHGRVREAQLSALKPASSTNPGPDLLLWDLPDRASVGLRSMYMMGLWAWSIRPRQLRCVLPPATGGDPPLIDLRRTVSAGLEAADADVRPELLQRPGDWEADSTRGLFAQILQSMLAGSRRANPRGPGPKASRPARAWGWAVGMMVVMLAGAISPARAQSDARTEQAPPGTPLVTVEIRGIDLDDPALHRRPDGTRVSSGRFHLLRLEAGIGTRAEGVVTVTTPRATLHALNGGEALDWTPRRSTIDEVLLLDAPEFTLQARSGRFEITRSSIAIVLADESSVLPGRQGLMLAGVLLVVIVMLFLRAASMRRRLDKPYEPMRRRRRPPSDDS